MVRSYSGLSWIRTQDHQGGKIQRQAAWKSSQVSTRDESNECSRSWQAQDMGDRISRYCKRSSRGKGHANFYGDGGGGKSNRVRALLQFGLKKLQGRETEGGKMIDYKST